MTMHWSLSWLTLAASLAAVVALQVVPKDGASDYLLSGKVVPTHYDLTVHTYLDTFDANDPASFVFDGTVVITLHAVDATSNSIVLHKSSDLTVSTSTLRMGNTIVPLNPTPTYNATNEELTLQLESGTLAQDEDYTLTMVYQGVHGDDLMGFHKASYRDRLGGVSWLVSTQFQPTSARRAYPCFDEPKYKAKYKITVTVATSLTDLDYNVWSNTPIANKTNDPITGLTEFQFEETPVELSTYLVAIIVSDFFGSDTAYFNGAPPGEPEDLKELRTWGQVEHVKYNQDFLAQWTAKPALETMTQLLQIGYPYQKMHLMGIPDFYLGAMENWGCITFKERVLFFPYDEDASEVHKQDVVTTITHELSHQWLGDLVTMHWWSDTWLNEGFATFFEFHLSSLISTPTLDTSTWDLIGQMLVDQTRGRAFVTDGSPGVNAMTTEVYSPQDISDFFDDISYAKGGSVIRMWYHVLGEETYYQGLNRYLTNISDATSDKMGTPERLLSHWEAVYNASQNPSELQGLTVVQLFQKWHQQGGYPVLTVAKSGQDNTFTVTQSKFTWTAPSSPDTTTWNIPITYSTDTDNSFLQTAPSHILQDAQGASVNIELPAQPKWIILNNQGVGYYRVNYEQENWEAVIQELSTVETLTTIHEYNRAALVDDALSLARSTNEDYLSYDTAFRLTSYLKNEQGHLPWKAALSAFSYLNRRLAANETLFTNFKLFVQDLVRDQFTALSLDVSDEDSHLQRLKRVQLATWACDVGLPECLDQAEASYNASVQPRGDHGKASPPRVDVKAIVYCWAVRNGDAATFDKMADSVASSLYNYDQLMYLSALGCSKDADKIMQFLNAAYIDHSIPVRTMDYRSVLPYFARGNLENVAVVLQFLQDQLTVLAKLPEKYGLGLLIGGVADFIINQADIDAMNALKATIDSSTDANVAAMKGVAAAAVARIQANNAWLAAKQDEIGAWLAQFGTSS